MARGPRLGRALGPDRPDAVDLAPLPLRVDPVGRRRGGLVVGEAVDADDDLVAAVDGPLDPVRRFLDLALLEASLDRRERAAHRLDLVEVGPGCRLELVREALDVVGAGQRVGGLGHARLVRQDLLRPQGQSGGLLGRQGEGLVAGVRVQALGAAEHRRQGLDRRAHDVVVDRLGGER